MRIKVLTENLKSEAPFKDLMPFDQKAVDRLAKSMKQYGFDDAFPIVTWKGHENLVLDGQLRRAAAIQAGLEEVCVCEKEFASKEEAISYVFQSNTCRGAFQSNEITPPVEVVSDKPKRKILFMITTVVIEDE